MEVSDNTKDNLEKIMSLIGYGRFQRRFVCYIFISCAVLTAMILNLYQVLAVPDHWCRVPRPPAFRNLSKIEWKNLTLPKKTNIDNDEFEKCYMYNITNSSSLEGILSGGNEIIKCQYGWEYDQTWYTSTIPSQQDWVCEREIYSVHSSQLLILSGLCGQILLGLFADKFGRRPMFLISLAFLVIGRISILFTAHIYAAFLFSVFIHSLPSAAIVDASAVTGMEMISPKNRSRLYLILLLGHVVGCILTSLTYWAINKSLVSIYVVASLPLVGVIVAQSLFMESPRWLINRRRNDNKCLMVLKTICKYNRNEFSEEIVNLLGCNDTNEREARVRVRKKKESLLCNWNMIRLFLITLLGWIATLVTNATLFFNVNDIGGNPFLGYVFLTAAELPGYLLGKYFADLVGRRFSRVIFSILASVGSLVVIFIIEGADLPVTICYIFIKIVSSVGFFILYLHTSEIYPTSVRQSGLASTAACGRLLSSFAPHIVYLGRMHDKRIPFIVCALLGVLGALAAIFLPETSNRALPESVNDTEILMNEQKLWTMPKNTLENIY